MIRNKRKQKNIHTEFRYGNYDIQNKSINLFNSFEEIKKKLENISRE